MQENDIHPWQHGHAFGQDLKRPGERRTLVVIAITAAMMVVEIVAGLFFGSMALLADGIHMASHAAALTISAFAYIYARRQAHNPTFSFGTGKVNALAGFSSAVLLAVFAFLMAWESIVRLLNPVEIVFNQAILVAVLGLAVNGICYFILGDKGHAHDHEHEPAHEHEHGHEHEHESAHEHEHGHEHSDAGHDDHNLRAAYLHVLADALTSLLAIGALLAAKYLGFVWMDPLMGIVGAIMVTRWSFGLLRVTSGVLLDRQGPEGIRHQIKEAIEQDGDSRIADLHLWSIGPAIYAAVIVVVAGNPATPDHYRALVPRDLGLEHISVEVQQCMPAATAG